MKAEKNTKFTLTSNIPSDTIFFNTNQEIIFELKGNGEIYVKGKLIENDIELVNGMRELLNRDRLYQKNMQNDIDELVEFIKEVIPMLEGKDHHQACKLIQKNKK